MTKKLVTPLVILVAVVAGAWTAARWLEPPAPQWRSLVLLPAPRAVPDLPLQSASGGPDRTGDLAGRWTVLFAGFTHCPDICPATLAQLAELERRVPTAGARWQGLFLSVDPGRDPPDRLAAYVAHFSPTLRAATAAPDDLERLAAALGIAYVTVPGQDPDHYLVDHTAALVLLDPAGRVAGYFPSPHRVEDLAQDLGRLIDRAEHKAPGSPA